MNGFDLEACSVYQNTHRVKEIPMCKLLLSTLMLSVIFSSISFAEPTCENSPFSLIDSTIKFGSTTKKARSAVRTFRKRGGKKLEHKNLTVYEFKKPYKNLSRIVYFTLNDRVTRVMYYYHEDFMLKLGGRVSALTAMLEKLVEKHGKADDVDVDKKKGRIEAVWNSRKGAGLRVIADDADGSLSMRIDCNELEDQINAKTKKTVNFGF